MGDRRLTALRHRLHALAEPSGAEAATAAFVATELDACGPGELLTGLGGHGVAAVWEPHSTAPGPTVLLRAELDAIPVPETLDLAYRSRTPGIAHKCGHDGHMTMLLGVARRLAVKAPARGRLVLLFQPAEETGTGAAAVVADPRLSRLRPDWLFALHNLPGYDLGRVLVRPGAFAAGSAGLRVRLRGRTAHAAEPGKGRSPDQALGELIMTLVTLPPSEGDALELVTVTHARLGEPAFGIAPGDAELLATLRADDDVALASLQRRAATAARAAARRHGLTCSLAWEEVFPVTWNDAQAVALVREAARAAGLPLARPRESAFRWSEDFGVLARLGHGALFGLGAGRRRPGLHAERYDFNDALLPLGVDLLHRVALAALQSPPLAAASTR
ncbi:MAG: amidohydrolase [bacterium]|jgi:amidohydrolase|nr:amidohydrolase [bacterium]